MDERMSGQGLEICPEDQRGCTCRWERDLPSLMSHPPFEDPGKSGWVPPVHRRGNPCPDEPQALPVDISAGQGWGWGLLMTHKPRPTPGSSPQLRPSCLSLTLPSLPDQQALGYVLPH